MKARVSILLFYGMLIIASLWVLQHRLSITSDMSMFMPAGATAKQQLLVEQLRVGSNSRLILLGLQGPEPKELAQANRHLRRLLLTSGLFADINNGQEGLQSPMFKSVYQARYLLSPRLDAQSFNASHLRQALEQRLNELASAASPVVRDFLPADPTGEFLYLLQQWGGIDNVTQLYGVFFSADRKRSLMVLRTKDSAVDLDQQALAITAIDEAFAQLRQTNIELLLSGPVVFSVQARDAIRADVKLLSIMATLIVTLFLLLAYRSWRVALFSALPLLTGVLIGITAVTLGFSTVHGITIAFGSTLIGIAVDYPMHFFSHQMLTDGTVTSRFARIWPTLRLGVMTTVIGFSALVFSGYGGLIQLGVFSIAGLTAAALATRWLLPALLPEDFQVRPTFVAMQSQLQRLAVRAPRWRLPVLLLTGVMVTGLWYAGEAVWESDPAKLSPISQQSKDLDTTLRNDLRAPYIAQLLVLMAPNEERVLQQTESLLPQLEQWRTQGVLQGYESVTRWVPSQQWQRQRRAVLPQSAALRQQLQLALEAMPFRASLFDPFVEAVAEAKARPPLVRADYGDQLLGERIASLLFPFADRWVSVIPVHGVQQPEVLAALTPVAADSQIYYLDLKQESIRMMAGYRDRALGLVLWGALCITLVLWWGLKSWRSALAVMLAPAAVVIVVAAMIVGLWGQGLTLFHLIALLLVIGLGIDYALFFNRLEHHPDEWHSTFAALWKSWLTTVLVFGSLMLSNTVVLQTIGLSVALGVSLCLLFGAILARPAHNA